MSNDFAQILACYRSEQMNEQQWQAHLSDPLFSLWYGRVLEAEHVRRSRDA